MAYPFVAAAVNLGPARGPRSAFVVHMAEGGGTVGYLSRRNPNAVSVHFVIERSGRTVQMLNLDRMHSSIRASTIRTTNDADGFYGATAARAVMGAWADTRKTLGPNHASIAVEIEGFARDGPNTAQTSALKALYADLVKRYPGIRSLGHRDFASYKACPGKRIPWSQIGGHGPSVPGKPATQEAPVATVDLTVPSHDTVQLLRQWLQVRKYPATIPPASFFDANRAKAPQQIVELVANIVGHGATYYGKGAISVSVIKLARKLNAGNRFALTEPFEKSLASGKADYAASIGVTSEPVSPAAVVQ